MILSRTPSPATQRFAGPRLASVVALALVASLGACAKKPPEPAPVTLSAAEQVCVDHAITVTGADPATVTIAPGSATKTGETIYEVNVGAAGYNCVVGGNMAVASFTPRALP